MSDARRFARVASALAAVGIRRRVRVVALMVVDPFSWVELSDVGERVAGELQVDVVECRRAGADRRSADTRAV